MCNLAHLGNLFCLGKKSYRYKVREVFAGGGSALVEWRLETGRTHQVTISHDSLVFFFLEENHQHLVMFLYKNVKDFVFLNYLLMS
jgi:hypothetical protein